MRRIAWVLAVVLGGGVLAGPAWAVDLKPVRAEGYGIVVPVPKGWTAGPQEYDLLKADHHPSGTHNALEMLPPMGRGCRAYLTVHNASHQSLAQVGKAYVSAITSINNTFKPKSSRRLSVGGAKAYELVLTSNFANQPTHQRIVVWYHGGRRFVLMTVEPQNAQLRANTRDIEGILHGIQLLPPKPAKAKIGFVVPTPKGAVLPPGTAIEVLQLQNGKPLMLKPKEQLAFIFVGDIKDLEMELGKLHSLDDLVKGVHTRAGISGLKQDPRKIKDYRFTLTVTGKKSYRLTAVPTHKGLGGFYVDGTEFGGEIYYNPHGAAGPKDEHIGTYGFEGGFAR